MTTTNEMLVGRYFKELLSAPDRLEVANEILAEDVVFENPISKQSIKGLAEYRAFALRWYEGFPDRVFSLDETISEGDKIAARFTITGTNLGAFGVVAASSNKIEIQGVNIFRISNGKIQKVNAFFNPLDLWRPIGLSPGLSTGKGKATEDQVREAVNGYVQSFKAKDREQLLSVFSPEAVVAAPNGTPPVVGTAALANWFDGLMASFDAFDFRIQDLFIAGNEAALNFELLLHKGERVITLRGVDVFSVEGDGKIMGLVGYHPY